jgi:hypothetical protein
MKKCLSVVLSAVTYLFSYTAQAQQQVTKYYIDALTFKRLINNQFINIITGQTKNTIGNFGGIDFKDASATLNASKISKNYFQ